jgi:hypothetical protein
MSEKPFLQYHQGEGLARSYIMTKSLKKRVKAAGEGDSRPRTHRT